MMKKLALISFMIVGVIFISCEKEMSDVKNEIGISKDVIQKIESLDLNTSDLVKTTLERPDGTVEEAYLVEGCIAISPEQLSSMSLFDGIQGEQYRTYNLVSSPRTISVIGYTGGSNALTTKMRTALQWAVANYNALNIGLSYTLTFGTSYSTKDIVVYKTTGSAGGVAGFPSGGKPYKYVQIFSGTDAYDTNVIEHVITHEMGHCIGMRHTDWSTRQSCGQSGESANPDGAVHIPGTPTGYDSNSLMLACFGSGEDGEFGYYDIVALEYLY
ncbi:MAG: M57 family metalloprotease [Bacteroidales bacterium]|nr:M57 family metalloprotease [Bacteroidales bacterium]